MEQPIKEEIKKPEAKQSHKTSKLGLALIAIGVLLGLLAITLLVQNNKTMSPQPPRGDSQSQEAAPSAIKPKPKQIDNYSVAPALPKYIAIPSIDLGKTRIMELGLEKGNQIAAPNNIYDAGWYAKSSKPGQAGAMFIYGHVSSWQADGAFYDLKKLQPGDTVTVTRGDNKEFTYKVDESKVYDHDKVDMKQVLAPVVPGRPGLNLMTCTGHVIKGTSEFSERLVVFTSLVSS